MRIPLTVVLLLFPVSSFAQSSPCVPVASSVLQFDPYKPSDTAIVRNYGAALMSQLPLGALLKLDPYVPSQAALLRQVGGAIPLWTYPAYPAYLIAPTPMVGAGGAPCDPVSAPAAPVMTTLHQVWTALAQQRTATAAPSAIQSASSQTVARNSGVTVEHAGRIWVSAGPAVRFSDAEFVRIGDRAGSAVFQRTGGDDTVIFIPSSPGMVAPFRAAPMAR
jgi:hypothetical protein